MANRAKSKKKYSNKSLSLGSSCGRSSILQWFKYRLLNQAISIWIPILPLESCVIRTLLHLTVFSFPPLWYRHNYMLPHWYNVRTQWIKETNLHYHSAAPQTVTTLQGIFWLLILITVENRLVYGLSFFHFLVIHFLHFMKVLA